MMSNNTPPPHNTVIRRPDFSIRLLVLFAVASGCIYIALLSTGSSDRFALSAAIALLCMGYWATGAAPEIFTTLLFFALATTTAIAPPAIIFSGFASSAIWLVLSGMIVGLAINSTGLGKRIARSIAGHLSTSYPRLIGGIIAGSYGLSFVMPSNMGRIALLVPIVLALADHVGLAPGRRGRIGVVLAVGFSTFMMSASILPSNVPNLVMAGAAENLFGIRLSYLPYLMLHGPVVGVAKGIVLTVLILVLFKDKLNHAETESALEAPPMSGSEWRLASLLVVTLVLWMSDSVHHIPAAWIGLAAAVICFAPGIGSIPVSQFGSINFRTVFYVAGLLGLVAAVESTGLGSQIGRLLVKSVALDGRSDFFNFMSLFGLSSSLSLIATANGEPALFTPLARELATTTGFDITTVIMTQVIGFSTVFFPYQAPPIIVAAELGGVTIKEMSKLSLASALATVIILVPLDFLWWRFLSMF